MDSHDSPFGTEHCMEINRLVAHSYDMEVAQWTHVDHMYTLYGIGGSGGDMLHYHPIHHHHRHSPDCEAARMGMGDACSGSIMVSGRRHPSGVDMYGNRISPFASPFASPCSLRKSAPLRKRKHEDCQSCLQAPDACVCASTGYKSARGEAYRHQQATLFQDQAPLLCQEPRAMGGEAGPEDSDCLLPFGGSGTFLLPPEDVAKRLEMEDHDAAMLQRAALNDALVWNHPNSMMQ